MSSSEAELSRREPVVRLKSISKEFPGVLAVDGVDLEILSGEVHVVAGENGAGKPRYFGMGLDLDAIAAAVIGGRASSGGRGLWLGP